MSSEPDTDGPGIHEVEPRETVGRETAARYQAQFRAAAYACLQILKGHGVDRVYCDFHDDFVCRETQSGARVYHFYQVKTKGQLNYQWSRRDVFGVKKRGQSSPEDIADSFAGKLMLHTIRFNNSCGNVVFLTNVYLEDELESVAAALTSGELDHELLQKFMENFNDALVDGDALDEDSVREKVKKLRLTSGVSHLNPHSADFEALAREAIFKYSEIDLQHAESQEIINNLVSLVERKSSSKLIANSAESDLNDAAGIGITDLLEILSISKGAYAHLMAGGDPKALKSASIIQRKLSAAGADERIIEYCSKCKVDWDIWLRDKRHTIHEYDINMLLDKLNAIQNSWSSGQLKFGELDSPLDSLWKSLANTDMASTLSKSILVGGVLSALVRSESL